MSAPRMNRVVANFKAEATRGKTIELKELRGQNVVLYFYPKDSTPGCTTEGRDFLVSILSFPLQLILQRFLDGGQPLARFRASPRGLMTVGLLSGISQVCFVTAVTRTDVANVVVIVASSPIMAAVPVVSPT